MRVLVLCHGNVNRSPFVAALIAQQRPGWDVQSAGLKTTAGRPATPKAKLAASERGLSLMDHRSRIATRDWCEAVNIILYMDGGNARRLLELVGEATFKRKAELLAEYGSLRRVPDPNYTSEPAKLREMFAAAELCTMKFLEAHP